jgi:hypothetical protein
MLLHHTRFNRFFYNKKKKKKKEKKKKKKKKKKKRTRSSRRNLVALLALGILALRALGQPLALRVEAGSRLGVRVAGLLLLLQPLFRAQAPGFGAGYLDVGLPAFRVVRQGVEGLFLG